MKKLLHIFGIFFLVLAVAHIALNLLWGIQLRNTIRDLKAQGKLKSWDEIKPPPVPDSENAALIYEKAFALMIKGKGGEKDIPGKTLGRPNDKILSLINLITTMFNEHEQFTAKQKEEMIKLFYSSDIQNIFALVEKATKKTACSFNIPYEKGYKAYSFLPPYMHLRGIAKMLSGKAILESESGNTEKALNTIRTGLKLSSHLQNEPNLISQMVRIAIDTIMIETLKKVFQSGYASFTTIKQLRDALANHDDVTWMLNAMDMETAIALSVFEEFMQNKMNFSALRDTAGADNLKFFGLFLYTSILARPVFKKDISIFLTLRTQLRNSYENPYYAAAQNLEKNPIERQIPFYCVFSKATIPNLTRIFVRIARHQAHVRVATTALLLKLYKSKHLTYPDSLNLLVPEFLSAIPEDPFSGKSFVYKKSGGGFILYSLGLNMKDDNGKSEEDAKVFKNGEPVTDDIVWESKQ